MREFFIDTEHGKIWCSAYGEKQANTPLLVVHGGPGFLSMPQTVSDFSTDRPVYFYDQSGCGRSDKAEDSETYSLDNYVEELSLVRNKLGLSEVVLLGFSWGCGLICSYMLKKKPAGVRGIILSGPLLSSPMWEKDQKDNISELPESFSRAIMEGERTQNYIGPYQEAMMEYYSRFVCALKPWPAYLEAALEALNMDVYLTMWGPSEFTVTGKLKNFDLYPELSNINQPVLLTCGDNDEAGVNTVKLFQKKFSNAYMAVIPNATHMHHIEQPEIYKTVVNSFLCNK